jgi:hypothetical protein
MSLVDQIFSCPLTDLIERQLILHVQIIQICQSCVKVVEIFWERDGVESSLK